MRKHLYSRQPTLREAEDQFKRFWAFLSEMEQTVLYNWMVDMENIRETEEKLDGLFES